ncbi:Putative threonine/lysine efflux protein family [Vibrio nigripulchritudo SFn27]|uniref:Putative threonine/lysine efflux protein family n=1 Tax=Vibrio nigripulchritudo TaxID=28173 RepID=U4JXE3_9VIBR|nr:LysE family translocator [Vibrio nigripulchritudo]CCN85203.1 Putative threonine/lysine efflux protein family [Vibrio nigripulchritudo BLFn1]CCN87647.1 Putative threonine/lysine efflux protein family [Vibrio nigripulchritudo SFn27]CCN92528.1 Putative threonine/lysine efflux protein family [Vibrio nigripulchritudo ENn2]CCO39391.1 Putative threonine/lysine efflux protein family [Vibrio nigripulchritudo SFn135]CCO53381.1 Putative threonine/lysine efflux protein family [Vibrio nigripulchritudo W
MDWNTWMIYVAAIFILTASPGPSVLLCLSKSVTQGFRSSIFTALGSLSAIMCILTLSFTGLGMVIATSEWVFNIIKWAGAAYLIYLGVQAFMSKQENYEVAKGEANRQSHRSLFTSGFIVGSSNPKAIVFFTALFPQFIDPQASLLGQYFVLASTFAVMELSWLLIYAYLGAKSSHWLLQNGRAKLFNKLTGGVFVGSGVILSTTSR